MKCHIVIQRQITLKYISTITDVLFTLPPTNNTQQTDILF